jgi:hypothetical protein
LTACKTSSFLTWSAQLIFCILQQHHISELLRYFWSCSVEEHFNLNREWQTRLNHLCCISYFCIYVMFSWLVFFLFNATFVMPVLDLILCVHLASFVIRLPK